MYRSRLYFILFLVLVAGNLLLSSEMPSENYFVIKVVDEQTGRGVPLVELSTVNNISRYTDNNGIVAFYEPGLMNRELFFYVKSHGYLYPKDGFGYEGLRLMTKPGVRSVVKIKRQNIAERLYRITGYGTYRDSYLIGEKIPVKEPLLNGQVFGQDTVIAAIYKGRLFWCWGDTMRPSYPLGNFAVSGATSELPSKGGLPPSVGTDLKYFVDSTGFSKQMCPIKADGPKWLEGLMVLANSNGKETLLARYAAIKDLGHINEFGLAIYNDEKEVFERAVVYPTKNGYHKSSHPILINNGNEPYYYLFPTLRIKAQIESIKELNEYENFTCVKQIGDSYEIERSPDGKPLFKWRKGIAPFNPSINEEAVRKKLIKPEENWIMLHNSQTGKPTKTPHQFNGSVYWNKYRGRWIMITQGEAGEIWFSEADTPTGPWVYARLIINHNKYNFYNPTQHPFFDEGNIIYFEGTYTASFSGAPTQTPMYEYNQVMYQLDLSDARLVLPMPVYYAKTGYLMGQENQEVVNIPFYAVPVSRKLKGMEEYGFIAGSKPLRIQSKAGANEKFIPIFCALPRSFAPTATDKDSSESEAINNLSSFAIPLYEYRLKTGEYIYLTDSEFKDGERSAEPVCKVWKNPLSTLAADWKAKQIKY